MNTFKLISRVLFWISIIYLVLVVWTITLGQRVPYEFRDEVLKSEVYDSNWTWPPVAILMTLFGTIKKRYSSPQNVVIVLSTVGTIFLFYIYLINHLFMGSGEWRTYNIAYQNRLSPERQIKKQRIDLGVMGNHSRVVDVQPFTPLFWKVTRIDTTRMDKNHWERVDIDIAFDAY